MRLRRTAQRGHGGGRDGGGARQRHPGAPRAPGELRAWFSVCSSPRTGSAGGTVASLREDRRHRRGVPPRERPPRPRCVPAPPPTFPRLCCWRAAAGCQPRCTLQRTPRAGTVVDVEDMDQLLLTCSRHKFSWDASDGRPVSALGCGPVACAPSRLALSLPHLPCRPSGPWFALRTTQCDVSGNRQQNSHAGCILRRRSWATSTWQRRPGRRRRPRGGGPRRAQQPGSDWVDLRVRRRQRRAPTAGRIRLNARSSVLLSCWFRFAHCAGFLPI